MQFFGSCWQVGYPGAGLCDVVSRCYWLSSGVACPAYGPLLTTHHPNLHSRRQDLGKHWPSLAPTESGGGELGQHRVLLKTPLSVCTASARTTGHNAFVTLL